jgi:flagellar basal body-associated protein FliL
MKKIILILVVLILLGGGAAAVWWYFLRAPTDEAAAHVEEVPPPVLSQVDLPLTSISIIKNNKSTQRVDFLITVVFDDPEKQKSVTDRMPLLTDGILTELHGLLPRKMVEQGGFDRAYLEQRLTKMAEARFGAGMVHQIYIKDMQVYK